jgi:hypothetical protein
MACWTAAAPWSVWTEGLDPRPAPVRRSWKSRVVEYRKRTDAREAGHDPDAAFHRPSRRSRTAYRSDVRRGHFALGARRRVTETRDGEFEQARPEQVDSVTRHHLRRLLGHEPIDVPDGSSRGDRIQEIDIELLRVLVDEQPDRDRPSGAPTILAHQVHSLRGQHRAHRLDAEAVGDELTAHSVQDLVRSVPALRRPADQDEHGVGPGEARGGQDGSSGEPGENRAKARAGAHGIHQS